MLTRSYLITKKMNFSRREISYNTPSQKIKMTTTSDQILKIQLRSANATVPTKGSATAAGYDIYASQDISIPAMGQGMVPTDISFTVPTGTYGRIAPRSGLAVKNGIQTGAGVVDRDYTGEVKVILFNHSQKDFAIKKGDRVAQLILEKIVENAQIVVVDSLEESARGAGGFGSTGN